MFNSKVSLTLIKSYDVKNSYTGWDKFFIAFGGLTIISGIYLTIEKDYVLGISGTLVGIWLVWQNLKSNKK